MSRLTGTDALGLFEAYQAVYAPQQELTEEQLWEDAEFWVYECIENGVDFSEYTLNELTEAFLIDSRYLTEDEAGRAGTSFGAGARQLFGQARRAVGGAIANTAKGAVDTAGAAAQGLIGQKTTSKEPGARLANTVSRAVTAPTRFGARAVQGFLTGNGSGPAKPPITSGRPESRFAGARDDAIAKARQIQGSPVVGPKPSSATPPKPAPGTPPKPAPGTPPKPAPTAATTKPAASPAAKPAGSAMDQWAAANPKLAAAKAERDRTRGTSSTTNPLMKDMKSSLPAAKPAATPAVKPAATPAVKPAATPAATQKPKPAATSTLTQSFDFYDVVMGHLLDEGYADTEEAALVIMANMSEEWKSSIIQNIV